MLAPPKQTITFPVPTKGDLVIVAARQSKVCSVCGKPAVFWATASRDKVVGFMCPECFAKHGVGLGYGYGQVVVTPASDSVISDNEVTVLTDVAKYRIIFQRRG